jgi:chromosome segregation ATPase
LEAERAVTAQRVEAQVQTAPTEHQHQQQTQIAQLVQEQMHLYTEQHQTEAAERGRELKKLRKQLDRQRSSADKQFRELRQAAPADSDSDSEQQSQLQAQCTQLQLQHSQLQIQCTQLQTQHTELTAEHEQLKSQFSCSLNSNLQAQLTQLAAKHEQLQSQYTESVTEHAEAHKRQKDQHSSQIGNLRSQYRQCLQQYASIETAVRGTLEEWWVAADASLIEREESSVRTEPDTPQSVRQCSSV